MKYEITKGSEKDFEGAPEWAPVRDKSSVAEYFSSGLDEGSLFVEVGDESGEVYTFMGKYPNTKVIAERRPITEPVWDGEGVPPAGVECEYELYTGEWRKCRIEFVGRELMIVSTGGSEFSCNFYAKFRPIRSPEDVARDEAVYDLEHHDSSCESIYDAIAAGKIRGVKLE